ncbi:MAG: ATP-dependent RNA helicase RhlB [Calditrichaeota bacterium]|nr:MAG: ATP-dependent RNA helicase RhlB [Calditrichota bacterium]
MNLPVGIMHALADLDFRYCTPIQAEILHKTLKGDDAFGQAQTGTGKTAAFLITILNHFQQNKIKDSRPKGSPRALIVAPTRELVIQIARDAVELAKYYQLNIVTVFGGVDYRRQRKQLTEKPVDIIVATPGRLLDFNRNREINLRRVEILVLDEADRMLDMGFIPDVRRIMRNLPDKSQRQTLLFSATLTNDVKYLGSTWTTDPHVVEIEPEQVAVDTVDQKVYIVTTEQKFALLYNTIISKQMERAIIFCNRRDQARDLVDLLSRYEMSCALLSGDVQQRKRMKVLDNFKAGKIKFMVATDVAGRGIHVEGLNHVINYTLPQDAEDYVHRIGRTGRAGQNGTSISFACENDSHYIPAIEELLGNELICDYPDENLLMEPPPPLLPPKPVERRPVQRNRSRSSRPRRR